MRTLTASTALVLLATFCSAQTCSNTQTSQQVDAHIDALIQKMSIQERIAQLGDQAPAIPRLGLPAYNWWNEGLHGIARNGYATVFPQAIGLAATWDTALLHAVGDTVSTEARAKYNPRRTQDTARYDGLTIWSPNINIFRDPRWGRGQETYGEDPFLTASLGTQFVKGVQGDAGFYLKADATPKHFVAHSGPEEGRDSFHANASAHDLADTYLPAFHTLLTQGNAAALMCSYNAIGPTPSCANDLLQHRVRDAWGFQGYVVSDCDAVGNLTEFQHYTADPAHGAAAALNAGTDLDCGNSYHALNDAYAQHLVTEQTINRSMHRLLLARLRLGMLDDISCGPYEQIAPTENNTPAHRALALRAAEESIVLLKNDGALPLNPAKRLAIIGPTADSLRVLEANYHGTAMNPVTPLDGLTAAFRNVAYAQGSVLTLGTSVPVPSTALRTSAAPHANPGLTAEYFTNTTFQGAPAVSTIVPHIDLDLNRAAPDPRIPAGTYSARWTGVLVPPAPGDYLLHIDMKRCYKDCTTHSRFRFFFDGKLVLDNDGTAIEPNDVTLHAEGTAAHTVRLELVYLGSEETFSLEWQPPAEALLAEAVATASKADVIVACVGLSPDLEGEALKLKLDGFNGGDRTSLDLPAAQLTLLARLKQLHKPIIVVLTSGSAVALDAAPYNALLAAWYPGEAGGTALANILTGKTSPSGRLPLTFYRSVADLPDFSDYSMAHRTYRYFTGPVLYPFGFGLSYTHFAYDAMHLSTPSLIAGQPITVTATLRNTGERSSDEVAELYLVPPPAPGSPNLTLQGIQRVTLAPGQSHQLTFTLQPVQLSFVDPAGHRAIRSGTYRLFLSGAQPTPAELANPNAGTPFTITGEHPMDF